MKKSRHEAIVKMIENETISTQEDLMIRLKQAGYDVTQATVSRDIKTLGLVKTPVSNGVYKYSLVSETDRLKDKYFPVFSHSVSELDSAGNIVAVKCFSGMAPAAAAAIDKMKSTEVVATLAGDDTVFVLCRTPDAAQNYKDYLGQFVNLGMEKN